MAYESNTNREKPCHNDIDPEWLRVAEIVAHRVVGATGTRLSITATLDRREALDGADYAINMVQIGDFRPATVTDFAVPKRFGLRQTIADTLGYTVSATPPPGWCHARHAPARRG